MSCWKCQTFPGSFRSSASFYSRVYVGATQWKLCVSENSFLRNGRHEFLSLDIGYSSIVHVLIIFLTYKFIASTCNRISYQSTYSNMGGTDVATGAPVSLSPINCELLSLAPFNYSNNEISLRQRRIFSHNDTFTGRMEEVRLLRP